MDITFNDIFPAILAVVFCAWWWFITKDTATRKYILLCGVCLLVTGIAYIIAESFDIPPLMLTSVLAFLGFVYFLIRATLSERKAKKKSSDE